MNPWLCMPPENSVDWGKWDMLTGAAPVMKAAPQGTLRVPAFWPRGALDRVGLLCVGASSGFSGLVTRSRKDTCFPTSAEKAFESFTNCVSVNSIAPKTAEAALASIWHIFPMGVWLNTIV